MFLLPYLATTVRSVDLENYHGGSNPILLYLTIGLLLAAAVGAVGWLAYQRWRYRAFFTLCQDKDLSTEEYGFISSYAKRFHEKDLLNLLTKQSHFDRFVSRVAHHYETEKLSDDILENESRMLQRVRQRLGFAHSYQTAKLRSSRSLPIHHPVTVLLVDHKERNPVTFHSSVRRNNELCLAIAPPEDAIRKNLKEKDKLPLILTISRENDAEYHFETALVKVIPHPELLWIIRHCDHAQKGSTHKRLELEGTLSIANEEKGQSSDHPVTIIHLSREGCRFHFNDPSVTLEPPANALLTFKHRDQQELLRTHVTETVVRNKETFYRAQFNNLEREQLLRLQRIVQTFRATSDPKEVLPGKQAHYKPGKKTRL